ncbi:MAG: hypothetical protein AB7U63_05695 [Porticoccaceae bacterium]
MADTTSSDEISVEINTRIRDKERKKLDRSAKALAKTWSTWCEEPDRTEEDFDWVDDYLTSKGYITMPLVQPTDWASKRKRINGVINHLVTSGANPGLDEVVNDLRKMRGAWRAKKSYNTTRKRQIRLVLTKEDRTLLKEIGGTLAGRATFKKQIMLCLGKYKAIENDISKKNTEIGRLHGQLESLKLELRNVRSSHEQLSTDNNELKEKLADIHKVNEQLTKNPQSSPDSEPGSDESKLPFDRASSHEALEAPTVQAPAETTNSTTELAELRCLKSQVDTLSESLAEFREESLSKASSLIKISDLNTPGKSPLQKLEEIREALNNIYPLLSRTMKIEKCERSLGDLLNTHGGLAQLLLLIIKGRNLVNREDLHHQPSSEEELKSFLQELKRTVERLKDSATSKAEDSPSEGHLQTGEMGEGLMKQ